MTYLTNEEVVELVVEMTSDKLGDSFAELVQDLKESTVQDIKYSLIKIKQSQAKKPNRTKDLPELFEVIENLAKSDLRVCQMIGIAIEDKDLFNIENDVLIELLKEV